MVEAVHEGSARILDAIFFHSNFVYHGVLLHQVKPLLEVTKEEEKLRKKEEELKNIREKLDSQVRIAEETEKRYKQVVEEKTVLAEQLQAEIDLCAEAEEMRIRYFHVLSNPW